MNKQREVVYTYRNDAIDSDEPRKLIYEVIDEAVPAKVQEFLGTGGRAKSRITPALLNWVNIDFPARPDRGEGAVRNAHGGGERAVPDREDQGIATSANRATKNRRR